MLDTFLIKTLRIIASDDLKIIQQFMGVNFFNGGPRKLKCIKLLTCLIHLKPSYDDAKRLHRSYVCRTTGIKDEGELTKVAAELLSVIRKSLLHIRYNRLPDTQHHLDMARVFNEAQHTQFFEQSIEKAKQANHKQAYQDTDFNLIDWQLKEEVIIHNSRFVTLKNPISMSGVIDSLDRLYIHKNLLYESALLARSAFSTNDNPSSIWQSRIRIEQPKLRGGRGFANSLQQFGLSTRATSLTRSFSAAIFLAIVANWIANRVNDMLAANSD